MTHLPAPTITFGMPIFNGGEWLERAIESILNQDYSDIELLIVDDCSTDNSWQICQAYALTCPYLRLYKNHKNVGSVGNYQEVLSKARGDYFVYASQDDFWEPDFASKLISQLHGNDDVVIAMGKTRTHSWNKCTGEPPLMPRNAKSFSGLGAQAFYLLFPTSNGDFLKTNLYMHGLIRTNALRDTDKAFPGMMGWDRTYLLPLALMGKWILVDKVLYHRQLHNLSLKERRPKDPFTKLRSDWFRPLIEAFKSSLAVVSANNISIYHRILGLCILFLFVFSLVKPLARGTLHMLLSKSTFGRLQKLYRYIKKLMNVGRYNF